MVHAAYSIWMPKLRPTEVDPRNMENSFSFRVHGSSPSRLTCFKVHFNGPLQFVDPFGLLPRMILWSGAEENDELCRSTPSVLRSSSVEWLYRMVNRGIGIGLVVWSRI